MIRVVVSVALAAALLAVSLPAVDSARSVRTGAHLDAELASVNVAAASLYDREEPTRSTVPGARRVISLRVPAASWTTAPIASVTVGCRPEDCSPSRSALSYELENGRQRRVRLGVPLRVTNGPIVFDGPGTHRLVLTLVRTDGNAVVVARRG